MKTLNIVYKDISTNLPKISGKTNGKQRIDGEILPKYKGAINENRDEVFCTGFYYFGFFHL